MDRLERVKKQIKKQMKNRRIIYIDRCVLAQPQNKGKYKGGRIKRDISKKTFNVKYIEIAVDSV